MRRSVEIDTTPLEKCLNILLVDLFINSSFLLTNSTVFYVSIF